MSAIPLKADMDSDNPLCAKCGRTALQQKEMFFDYLIGELLALPQIGPLVAKDAPKSKSAAQL